jgi:hypothetical protein
MHDIAIAAEHVTLYNVKRALPHYAAVFCRKYNNSTNEETNAWCSLSNLLYQRIWERYCIS